MKKLILLLLLATGGTAFTQAQQNYTNPKFKEITKQHKLIAILPFKTKISYKTFGRYFDYQANRNKEIDVSEMTQSGMYSYLLDRLGKNTIDFQDIDRTNTLLRKAGMIDSLDNFTKEEIAKTLGVDAVVSGKYEIEHFSTAIDRPKPKPAETSPATIEAAYPTGSVSTTIALNDAISGTLLWRYTTNVTDYSTFSTSYTVDKVMGKVSKNFPYTNK